MLFGVEIKGLKTMLCQTSWRLSLRLYSCKYLFNYLIFMYASAFKEFELEFRKYSMEESLGLKECDNSFTGISGFTSLKTSLCAVIHYYVTMGYSTFTSNTAFLKLTWLLYLLQVLPVLTINPREGKQIIFVILHLK